MKLVVLLTTPQRIRQCETVINPITVTDNDGFRLGLEEYGRDWAQMWKTDIVMLIEEEDNE